jgi:hypothetical protein
VQPFVLLPQSSWRVVVSFLHKFVNSVLIFVMHVEKNVKDTPLIWIIAENVLKPVEDVLKSAGRWRRSMLNCSILTTHSIECGTFMEKA